MLIQLMQSALHHSPDVLDLIGWVSAPSIEHEEIIPLKCMVTTFIGTNSNI